MEVVIQTADEDGRLYACASFVGLPIDVSVRITVISPSAHIRDDLFLALRQSLAQRAPEGGCGGHAGGRAIPRCRAHNRAGVAQWAVVAVDGSTLPPALEQTVQEFLKQPGAGAVGVLPTNAPRSTLPASTLRFQTISYAGKVSEAVDDIYAAAGVNPQERRAFVSYSMKDRAQAVQLVEALSDQRFQVFLDSRSIAHGSLWEEVLRDGLIDAAMVVVLETANSAGSSWVKREIGLAIARGAGVVAVQTGNSPFFRCITARYVGPATGAGPFVARQHGLLISGQRKSRIDSVVRSLSKQGISGTINGGWVHAQRHVIGVYPRPVTLRELRQTTESAALLNRSSSTFSPLPVLSAKQTDRFWMHTKAQSAAFHIGTMRGLVGRVQRS